ncbi:hypothetical protein BDV98DRAFT_586882 [Pterulicium gracile]|uniref:Uncharacterized protein n=1 Tax=Pterulicium gracile TaxID=1884261 RepID=A0A5C3Q0W0_9AGAR|nr:hypothetical protein BDV98DRAFT_586882 [Pterula gracilis]
MKLSLNLSLVITLGATFVVAQCVPSTCFPGQVCCQIPSGSIFCIKAPDCVRLEGCAYGLNCPTALGEREAKEGARVVILDPPGSYACASNLKESCHPMPPDERASKSVADFKFDIAGPWNALRRQDVDSRLGLCLYIYIKTRTGNMRVEPSPEARHLVRPVPLTMALADRQIQLQSQFVPEHRRSRGAPVIKNICCQFQGASSDHASKRQTAPDSAGVRMGITVRRKAWLWALRAGFTNRLMEEDNSVHVEYEFFGAGTVSNG